MLVLSRVAIFETLLLPEIWKKYFYYWSFILQENYDQFTGACILLNIPVVTVDIVDDAGSFCTVVTPLSPRAMAIKSSFVT